MTSRPLALAPAVITLALASCGATDRKASVGDIRTRDDEFVAIIKGRATAYPQVTVTDLTPDRTTTTACALVRLPGRQPHVAYAWMEGSRVRVASPTLLSPDTWESEGNRGLSTARRDHCARRGIHLPTE